MRILVFVGHVELGRLAQTCVAWRAWLDSHQEVWRRILVARWGDDNWIAGTVSWRNVYAKQMRVERAWRDGVASKVLLRRPSPGKKKCPVTRLVVIGRILIAASSADGSAQQLDMDVREWTNDYTGHTKPVTGMCVLQSEVLTCSEDRTLRLWDLASGLFKCEAERVHKKAINCLAMIGTRDSCVIALGSDDKTASVFDRRAGLEHALYQTPKMASPVTAVMMFSGTVLFVGLESGAILVWSAYENAESTVPVREQPHAHAAAVTALHYAPFHRRILSAGLDGAVRLWDWQLSAVMVEFSLGVKTPVLGAVASVSRLVAWSHEAVYLYSWAGVRLAQYHPFGPDGSVSCAALDDRNAVLVCGGPTDGSICIYDFRNTAAAGAASAALTDFA